MNRPSSIEPNYSTGHRTAFSAVGIPADKPLGEVGTHRWRPAADVSLSLEDLGSLQGATLVERLRTVAGRPLDVEEHLTRLRESAEHLSIQWPRYLNAALIEECVARNRAVHAAPDFGVVVLLTPGLARNRPLGATPTVIVHTIDLQWQQLSYWYQHGQPLVIAKNRNIPIQCWSPHMKTRSRMHYFMADQQAASSQIPFAGAIMLGLDGHVTESSVANLLVIQGEELISPPIDSVLHGLSLRRTIRLAESQSIPVRFEHITIDTAKSADGLLLTGSSGCLWVASQLDDVTYRSPLENRLYQQLNQAWSSELGVDYVAQAVQHTQSAARL